MFFHCSYILVKPSDSADKAVFVLVQTRQDGDTGPKSVEEIVHQGEQQREMGYTDHMELPCQDCT